MLSKLFKNEMKACSRLLLPLYLVLLVTTIMSRIVVSLDIFKGALGIIPGLIIFAYVISLIAIAVVSFVIIILRFYKNLMTDEGYLMFTLPVKSNQLINSKLYASLIWTVASLAAIIASIFAVVATDKKLKMFQDGLKMFSTELDKDFGNYKILLIVEFIIFIIIALFSSILSIYVSISLGQLIQNHKIIGSFAAYIAISTVMQIALTAVSAIANLSFDYDFNDPLTLPKTIFPILIIFILIFTIAFYWITNFIFKKKINLD